MPFSMGCTTTTEPLKSVFWLVFQIIHSMNARRKFPSPNWMTFSVYCFACGAEVLFNLSI